MGTTSTMKIVERCQVTPSPGAATEQLLRPLLYSDILFLPRHFMENVTFYNLPSCSESHLLGTIVPSMKNSLSLALKHFLPLAGKIVFPLTSGMPVSHYQNGDSIALAIAVSDADLNSLTRNLPRDGDQFHDLFAPLPPATRSPDSIKFSVSAIQVTLFPNQGISISIAHHHAIGDGSTCLRFMRAWAAITKSNGDEAHLLAPGQSCLSFYDRSGVRGVDSLDRECWDRMKMLPPTVHSTNSVPTHKVRATFVLTGAHVQKLIDFVANKNPSVARVSSFAAVSALLWTSLARSAAAAGEEVDDDEIEYLGCSADSRARLDPPLPDNYFGNCFVPVLVESTHGGLKGIKGLLVLRS